MELSFSPEELKKVEEYTLLYPEPKAALMRILWLAQAKWGWLSEDAMRCVADVVNLPYAHVLGVATFYTMYFKKPMGKHHVQVCTNVSCMLRGGDELYIHAKQKFGIGHNECTSDGRISLEEVECMGACGGAPMIAINEDFYENITTEEFDRLTAALV
jgi:NADH-quinone oxidoreductase E subunit